MLFLPFTEIHALLVVYQSEMILCRYSSLEFLSVSNLVAKTMLVVDVLSLAISPANVCFPFANV